MAKKTFETVLKWNGGEAFRAKVEVGADGWGRVFDTADGLYCGSINPLRTPPAYGSLWEVRTIYRLRSAACAMCVGWREGCKGCRLTVCEEMLTRNM